MIDKVKVSKLLLISEEIPSKKVGLEGIFPMTLRTQLESFQDTDTYWKTLGGDGSGSQVLSLRPTLPQLNHVN